MVALCISAFWGLHFAFCHRMAPVEGRCSSPYAQLADVCAWLLAYAMPAYLVLLIKLSPMFFSIAIVKVPAAA